MVPSLWIHSFISKITLSADQEQSLLEELWAYISGKYFSVELGRYQYIHVERGSMITLRNVILGICVGFIVAAIFACYEKNKTGAFIRQVIRQQCLWPDKAKTLDELGYGKNRAIRSQLKRTTPLSKTVICVEKEAFMRDVEEMRAAYIEKNGSEEGFIAPTFYLDFDAAHFYIPDEKHYAADVRFDNKGSGWRALLLVILVSVILASVACFLLPDMLQLVDNMIGILTPDKGF